jgi:hypothetical protein
LGQYVSNKQLLSGFLTIQLPAHRTCIVIHHSIPEHAACEQEQAEQQARSSLSTPAISVGIFVALVVA